LKKLCINDIRRLPIIESIIKKCAGFGRTWGKKNGRLYGSHICFINPEEIVLLTQNRNTGELILFNFQRVDKTNLGQEIAAGLAENQIDFKAVL